VEKLEQVIERLIDASKEPDDLRARLSTLKSVFPFNKYEYVLMRLLDQGSITFADYEAVRDAYHERNKYLDLYQIAGPRTFGETWAHRHLQDIHSELLTPSRDLDPEYEGQYDLYYDGIRIEVKASRAVNRDITNAGVPLFMKALHWGSSAPFLMNFQQLKPDCCDVFVWLGVWTDTIRYWVLTSQEVRDNSYYSPQHRGGQEYQIMVTDANLHEFGQYLVPVANLLTRVEEIRSM